MTNAARNRPKNLGEVEQLVMDCVWSHGASTAEACRQALASKRPMKDSTVRTILRRLEEKGYVTHQVDARTYVYCASEPRRNVAVRAVKHIVDRFCGGSVEELLVGMVANDLLDKKALEQLARKIARGKEGKP